MGLNAPSTFSNRRLVLLHCTVACRVALPSQAPGVCQVALLAGGKPPQRSTDATSSSTSSTPDAAASGQVEQPAGGVTAATAAPLLLLPLLVLPPEAAQELQTMWHDAAAAGAAAGHSDGDELMLLDTAQVDASATVAAAHSIGLGEGAKAVLRDLVATAWQQTVAALSVDLAYVLSACRAAAGGGEGRSGLLDTMSAGAAQYSSNAASGVVAQQQQQQGKLAAGVAAVFVHLLKHLAANQMFHTMKFLVEAATLSNTGGEHDSQGSSSSLLSSSSNGNWLTNTGHASNKELAQNAAAWCGMQLGSASRHTAGLPNTHGNGGDGCSNAQADASAGGGSSPAASAAAAAAAASLASKVGPNTRSLKAGVPDCSRGSTTFGSNQQVPGGRQQHCSSRVQFWQLLFGFADPQLEACFLAVNFSTTGMLDCVTAAYNAFMGIGAWFAVPDKHAVRPQQPTPQQQQLCLADDQLAAAAASSSCGGVGSSGGSSTGSIVWSFKLVVSVVVVLAVNVAMPLAILLLRLQTAMTISSWQQHAQKQGCQGQRRAATTASSSSSKPKSVGAPHDTATGSEATCLDGSCTEAATAVTGAAEVAASDNDAVLVAAYSRAGRIRRLLIAAWMVLVLVMDLLCATGAIITPVMIRRLWSLSSLVLEVIWLVGLGIKGWMYQVRTRPPGQTASIVCQCTG